MHQPIFNTPSGNTSVKSAPHRNFRRHLRMEKVARLEASGKFSNAEIAQIVGVTVQALWYIKAHPDYLRKRAELATGVISDIETEVRRDQAAILNEIQDSLPSALRVLRNAVERGAVEGASVQEIKIGMEAAKEILDRDGTFSKVSKTEIKVKQVPDQAKVEATEIDLLSVLQAAHATRQGQDKTQHTGALESFVNASGAGDAQERMKQYIKFEDFDQAGKPVM